VTANRTRPFPCGNRVGAVGFAAGSHGSIADLAVRTAPDRAAIAGAIANGTLGQPTSPLNLLAGVRDFPQRKFHR
jgi:hypothetical protein